MRPFDHAEAHERLADLAIEPGALARLAAASGADPDLDPLRDHLAGCADCRADLGAWRATWAGLDAATRDGHPDAPATLASLAAERPIVAPPELRDRIAAAVAVPVPVRAAPTRSAMPTRLPWRRVLPLVAALAILIGGLGLVRDQQVRLESARAEAAALEAVTATLDRLLADPAHWVVTLATADGTPAGTLAWSTREIVVMTGALTAPPAGSVYRCWLERAGVRTPVGTMVFAGSLATWSGSLDDWATIDLSAGGRFGVSLEPMAGSGARTAPVLAGDLAG